MYAFTNGRAGSGGSFTVAGSAVMRSFIATFSAGISVRIASSRMSLRNLPKLLPPLYPAAFTNHVKYSVRSSGVHPALSMRSERAYSICSSCVGASRSNFIPSFAATVLCR